MEMMYVELNQPEYYWHVSGTDPRDSYEQYQCSTGPYIVRVSDNIIEVDTRKPIAKAIHLRGKYGRNQVTLEVYEQSKFRVIVTDPDPYAETFRIFFNE